MGFTLQPETERMSTTRCCGFSPPSACPPPPPGVCRQHLLLLFEALIAPSVLAAAGTPGSPTHAGGGPAVSREAAARAAHANGVALMEARGVPLLVDVLAGGRAGGRMVLGGSGGSSKLMSTCAPAGPCHPLPTLMVVLCSRPCAASHEASDRPVAALQQTQLIADSSHAGKGGVRWGGW